MNRDFILASASPRRCDILNMVQLPFQVCVSDVDETIEKEATPSQIVQELAKRKAHAVFSEHKDALVLGADTLVSMEGKILGKPKDREDAANMLRLLSGQTHTVYTGYCLVSNEGEICDVVQTDVSFYPLTEEQISWYLDTGEPFDKAGAYAIQGAGSRFIEKIHGDYYNVVGLPISKILRKIDKLL